MNLFKRLFGGVKSFVDRVIGLIRAHVPDEVLARAIQYVEAAALKFVDNSQRREWAVKQLVDRGIPESIARLAVELAVQLVKKELN